MSFLKFCKTRRTREIYAVIRDLEILITLHFDARNIRFARKSTPRGAAEFCP